MLQYFFSPVVVAIAFLASCSIFPHTGANNGGFSVDLIHRDSQKSPITDPLIIHSERIKYAYQRSLQRSKLLGSGSLIPDGGEYLLKMSFGTPPVDFFVIADTGSDTSWIQCLPCIHCYKQKSPPFDPKKSSTFQPIPCNSKECKLLPIKSKCKPSGICLYNETYGDNSFSRGDLATETITFPSPTEKVKFPNFIFGCGHDNGGDNGGTFTEMTSGLLGLGTRKLSLATQLKSRIDGKFSFCLGPFTETSRPGKLGFGTDAIVSGPGVDSTPLIIDDFYYLILDAVSVGNKIFKVPPLKESPKHKGGNIIIDSGTTYTFLPSDVYTNVEKAVRNAINSNSTTKDPLGIFPLCYSSLKDSNIPRITFHFKGADVLLKPLNAFVKTSDSSSCLAFISTTDIPIFGNVAQMNFLVGYDLVKEIISFKDSDCTK
ncbi:hypothetical protein M9H77_02465 [Catharanthus roseus]|uniref:Uncharacterized protein n=1 Tax=Catharanthus roseus TaxID=4058 RepID=A0ACC0C8Z2_CATRO|nr:hypothetical protein M9H77_02465 [Catharanthus roseus]